MPGGWTVCYRGTENRQWINVGLLETATAFIKADFLPGLNDGATSPE